MKKISCAAVFSIGLFLGLQPAFAAEGASFHAVPSRCEKIDTQAGLNECTGRAAEDAAREMNKELNLIRKNLSNRPEKLKAFDKAQQAWEGYVRAQLDMLYMDDHGSMAPMCGNVEYRSYVQSRVKELRDWVKYSVDNGCGANLTYDPEPDCHDEPSASCQ